MFCTFKYLAYRFWRVLRLHVNNIGSIAPGIVSFVKIVFSVVPISTNINQNNNYQAVKIQNLFLC